MHKTGFTLIELSIVLVIIGLIVGGVLVGRDLIHQSQLSAQIAQISSYNAAVHTFQTKYNCMPGDCVNASQFFSGATNGNGNGQVASVCDASNNVGNVSVDDNYESPNLWTHFKAAGLAAAPGAQLALVGGGYTLTTELLSATAPPAKLATQGWVMAMSFQTCANAFLLSKGNGYVITGFVDTVPGLGGHGNAVPLVSPSDVAWMDSKIDDGLAGSGTVNCGSLIPQTLFEYPAAGHLGGCNGAANTYQCVTGGGGNYVNSATAACAAIFANQF